MRTATILAAACLAACAPSIQGLPGDAPGAECHPAPDPGRPQYVVGYGSLMQDESRKRTSPQAGSAHPVDVRGFHRGWFARGDTVGPGTTYLGASRQPQSHFNAVMYEVTAAELGATDRRELSYCRAAVAMGMATPLEGGFSPATNAQVWIYLNRPENTAVPSSRYPIVQSYVDIFLSGCLEQEQRFGVARFAEQCVTTTGEWSFKWVNDRIHPRRPFAFQPKAREIDGLLSRQLPEHFSRIRIEPGE